MAARSAAAADARLGEAIDRLPVTADYSALLTQLHAPAAAGPSSRVPSQVDSARTELVSPTLRNGRDAAVQQRLDAFRDRFSGPYNIAGGRVSAPPMFRMNTPGSFNAAKMKAHAGELSQICAKAGVASAAGPAMVGRCTPEQLVKVTQALLDAGKLPPADAAHRTPAERVRGMQWEWGVGVDCAGYTQQAAADAHGAAGKVFKANPMGDVFSGMINDKRFQTVDIAHIRAGDVLHLDALKAGAVGHNVVCYSHATLDDATRAKMLAPKKLPELPLTREATAFLSGKGPFHTFEVDSSWGAGDGLMVGGFRRDTWLFDESTSTWASYPSGDRRFSPQVFPMTGPQNELFRGAFRPREPR